jgi:DNA-binding NarL/FixJ family response regulator
LPPDLLAVGTRPISVLLREADDALFVLLEEVLGERGFALHTDPGSAPRPELVLVLAHRGESLPCTLQQAREGIWPAPVFVLVPFADERMMTLALKLGARGCFALGQPLDELCHLLLAAVPGEHRVSGGPEEPRVIRGASIAAEALARQRR